MYLVWNPFKNWKHCVGKGSAIYIARGPRFHGLQKKLGKLPCSPHYIPLNGHGSQTLCDHFFFFFRFHFETIYIFQIGFKHSINFPYTLQPASHGIKSLPNQGLFIKIKTLTLIEWSWTLEFIQISPVFPLMSFIHFRIQSRISHCI